MEEIINIENDFVNTRIDRWIKKKFNMIPQNFIEKSLRLGKIKVNKIKVKSSYRLKHKDKIYLFNFKPTNTNIHKKKIFLPSSKELSNLEKLIIENNEDFIVINKPYGLPVQGGTRSYKNLVDLLSKSEIFVNTKPYIVHRIDKETSGILLIAKTREYAQLFTSLFRLRKIHKEYLGICHGELQKDTGKINYKLVRYEKNKKIEENAETYFNVIDKTSLCTFLSLKPITGRKHQLRKHLSLIGHPIYGDKKYNYITKNKSNLLLHSFSIKFLINGKKYNYKAHLPDYFIKMLKIKKLSLK